MYNTPISRLTSVLAGIMNEYESDRLERLVENLVNRSDTELVRWNYRRSGSIDDKNKGMPWFIFHYEVAHEAWDHGITGDPEEDKEWLETEFRPLALHLAQNVYRETRRWNLESFPNGLMYEYLHIPEGGKGQISRSKRNTLSYEGYGEFGIDRPPEWRPREARTPIIRNDNKRQRLIIR